ncbi:MAG: hypothetical protein ACYSQY_00275 [Planctomycetota bacterium]|jgi:hypothetical protein
MLEKNRQEDTFPWKKELIVSLFKRQKMWRILLVVALIPVVVLFLWLFFSGLGLYRTNASTFFWVKTPCVIESVDWQLDAKESSGGLWDPADPDTRDDSLFETTDSNHYKIRYRYEHNGKSYVSSRYSIPRAYEMVIWKHTDEHYDNYSQFEPKQNTYCYVNSESPEHAVLMRYSLVVSDYALHLPLQFIAFTLYLVIPGWVIKKFRDDRKQLKELITGEKQDILEEMNRLSDPLDEDKKQYIKRGAVEQLIDMIFQIFRSGSE